MVPDLCPALAWTGGPAARGAFWGGGWGERWSAEVGERDGARNMERALGSEMERRSMERKLGSEVERRQDLQLLERYQESWVGIKQWERRHKWI